MKGISNLIRFHFRLDVKVRRKLTTKDEYSSLPGARCENMILFAIFVLLTFTTYQVSDVKPKPAVVGAL